MRPGKAKGFTVLPEIIVVVPPIHARFLHQLGHLGAVEQEVYHGTRPMTEVLDAEVAEGFVPLSFSQYLMLSTDQVQLPLALRQDNTITSDIGVDDFEEININVVRYLLT